jgi:hypothetical protein
MAVTITATPASGSIEATKTAVRFDIAGAVANDAADYDADQYPTQAEFRYVLTMKEGGTEYGRSQVFGVSPEGAFQFNSYIFPHDGTWTVQVYDVTVPPTETAKTTALTLAVS